MAITAQDVKKLRDLTNAGMMDCKKALTEANGDFERARDILREKGLAVAAKRADHEASEGVAMGKVSADGKFGAAIILNSETDFVAANEKFIALANSILDVAVAQRPADLAALKALKMDGATVEEKVAELVGVIREKMEISAFQTVAAEKVACYIHMNRKIAALVGFNQNVDDEAGKNVAIQVATMSPVAVDRNAVPQATIDNELTVAIEKTKEEQVSKAVEAALKKAGLNPAWFDSEEHIDSNLSKGWFTEAQAAQAREIKATVGAQAAANIKEDMVQNIAKGRLNKFFKESTLVEQEYVMGDEKGQTVGQYLAKINKDLKPTAMVRLALA